ncbi:MAG: c-type cytochrome [Ardenticatenales bacterium]|nr:c-type cytochrome [Ardenticatenales bacterium]
MKQSKTKLFWPAGLLLASLYLILVSCQEPGYRDYLVAGEQLSGGAATVFMASPNAFGQPLATLERLDKLEFFVGNSFFNQNWVSAPASTTARDGLGPLFNARSCASCHFKDGRGRPPEYAGEQPTGFLVRFTVLDETGQPLPDPVYGGQLQDGAIQGVLPEGAVVISYEEVTGHFDDGTPYTLRRPVYSFVDLNYGALADNLLISPRVGNQMIGLGLLEAIPEAAILALADPDDVDGDGISGRPNMVWDKVAEAEALGRFGWKANQPSLLQQTADAFLGDLGITTFINPLENCGLPFCADLPNGGQPEISDEDLAKVVLYASSLAVPARRDWDDAEVLQGKALFMQANCHACHTPSWQTGPHPTIAALADQTIYPYTDLLLHDMGPELADNRPDFLATGTEWRTAPLWGLGLIETVNGHTFFLHDGRARNLMEAILWHGGEAAAARDAFLGFSAADRAALIRFLESQ